MKILDINYINFRNLKDDFISLDPKINVFYGKNAQGKTSFLESISFNAKGFSFRTKKCTEIIKTNNNIMGSHLKYSDTIGDKNLTVKVLNGKKEFKYNGKKITHNEYYGKVNIVVYVPEDIILINGSPSIRRNFFDAEISQSNKEYLENLKTFNKLLKFRNKYLKEKKHKSEEFEIYQEEFVKKSAYIIKTRLDYVKKISIILNLNYRKLFDNKKELSLKYESSILNKAKLSLSEIEDILRENIEKKLAKEIRYGFSLIGPQKDDFILYLNSTEAKISASQGEKKSIIFSLKLAEIDMILRDKKENPILIIDDITSYFDKDRRKNVLSFLVKRDIQVFISSTDKLDIESKNFYVNEGVISEDEN